MLWASPREVSGSHARRREDDARSFEALEDEETGLDRGGAFSCSRAIYPGMLSFADGVGWM